MLERGSGRIINIASLSSFVALAEVAAYSASKAAVALSDKVARGRVGATRHQRQRHRAGVFRTALNRHLLDDTERGRELLLRTPTGRLPHVDVGRRGRLSRLRRVELRHGRGHRRGRRLPRQRRQQVDISQTVKVEKNAEIDEKTGRLWRPWRPRGWAACFWARSITSHG